MQTVPHTPTPWKLNDDVIYSELHNITQMCSSPLPQEEIDANAAFIVRAVNAHEELVNACKVAYMALYGDEEVTGVGMPVGRILEEAIAKAEG